MTRGKYLISGIFGLALVLAVGLGMSSAVHAQTNSNNNNNNTTNSNNSSVSGDCRDISNTQVASSDNTADNSVTTLAGIVTGTVNQGGNSSSQSNNTTQTANFNCTTVRQVQAPVGAVDAGAGALALPMFGMGGSLASAVYGLYRAAKHGL